MTATLYSGEVTESARELTGALTYARQPQVRARWLAVLRRLVALPTVAGSGALEVAAELLCQELARIGLRRSRVIRAQPGAPPSVWAEWRGAPGRPCVLLYGHFDVQPAGPQAWRASPFDATISAGRLYGRGASDNKGPLVCLLAGLDSYLATGRRIPVNVRVWLEGEEERGSPHLPLFLHRHGDLLRADGIALSDSARLPGDDRPTLVTGLRGMLDLGLRVMGPAHELHSGSLGGEVLDPALVLSGLVSSLWDIDGRVRVAGFYRTVHRPTAAERNRHAASGPHRRALAKAAGVAVEDLRGECDWAPGERSTLRPSLTVVGLSAGRTGPTATAVVPTTASARINIRLVPDQRPSEIMTLLRRHLRRTAPPGARFQLQVRACAHPLTIRRDQPLTAALHRALGDTWGVSPALIRNGGTIPIVAELHRRYRMPTAMWGLSGADDRIHAADESIALADLHRGTEVVTRLLYEAAR